ncbi:glycosyltransferase [Clostridium putrefaciens]|uniref:Glycosyltransferase n=1 Tax=Clostridium putrefaciens TaxID=99675 RepID=A0A381J4N2_9CLOT|nr:glycosyltransferase family 4 protein [Clostridium putrefaciens]SUY45604.1 glycosyltransferase [Clostridium putrefaciens]
MNVLFIGVRWDNEEDITSAPQKIGNILYNRLSKDKEDFYFYGLQTDESPGENVEFQNINEREARGDLKHISSYIKDKDIKVIYIARYHSAIALYAIYLKFKHKVKIVYTMHGLVKKEKTINGSFKARHVFIEGVFLKRCDKIIAVSKDLKLEVLKYYPLLLEENIEVINNGVSIISIKEDIDIRTLYNIESDKNILFTVGVRKIKNIDIILQSFINNKGLYESSYLLVTGEKDSEYAIDIMDKYEDYDHIVFTGYVDTNMMNNIYNQMDVFIQISEFETFGMSIVESLLHKKHVIISSDLPIAKYFNQDEVRFYNKNEDDLSLLILDSLRDDDINQKGYEKARELFHWDKIKEDYYNLFMKL